VSLFVDDFSDGLVQANELSSNKTLCGDKPSATEQQTMQVLIGSKTRNKTSNTLHASIYVLLSLVAMRFNKCVSFNTA